MTLFQTLRAACVAAIALALPAAAHTTGGMQIKDAYATVTPQSGAIFLRIENHSPGDDRLVSVSTDAAEMAELHTNEADANGVMQMTPIEGGILVPKGEKHELARGGDHVMLMGLKQKLRPGDRFTVTFTFETFGPVTVEVPVVKPGEGAPPEDHSAHGTHGATN
ncbi:MAG: copper chaperone PCu(A)C [Paracoccaceae bacterium]